MTTADQPTGLFNQTYGVEFTVEGDLDGTTVQPSLLDSPPTGFNPGDPQNLFRRTVEALGLIDPDYLVSENEDDRRGVRGNRLVTGLWIAGSTPGGLTASVDVVDAVDGTSVVQKNIGTFVGSPTFLKEAIFVPQGSMIRVRGLNGSAAEPIKVRFNVQFLNNARSLAAALEAVCCLEAIPPPPVSSQVGYTPAVAGDWVVPLPNNVADALDRIAAMIGPIP